ELEEAEFSIVETTELVMDLIGSYTKKPNVELIYDIDEEVPEFLVGDATRLQQVLTNLVANAVKFTEEGEILVRIKVEKKLNESMVLRFEIKDTGIGIPADKLGRLFQSFSQVDASSTRKYGGTGLGLVISKRLIEAMNGEIWVTSTEGTGSTFSFIITLGFSNRIPTVPEFRILNNKNVFILDDNETNLRILKHHLVKARITVTTFKDPLLLLEKKDSLNEFDLGILDMQIPQKSGIDVAREIRELWDKKELPLVLFSSVHELENVEDRKLFNLYLRKPIQQSRFLINLEPLFNKARQKKVAEKNEMPSAHLFKKGVRILVAEDNKVNQKVILHILERLGITPQFAENGQIAAEMNATNNYDLILMDMEMPVMDGLEATKKILSDSSKSPVIIAMTANAMAEDKERCIKAGMDDFISKPVTVNSVKNLLTKWLGES
ncbi:MAG: response regulator, partial [Balneolales bacterium]|nr:response regulator [Balneolales bacterium]